MEEKRIKQIPNSPKPINERALDLKKLTNEFRLQRSKNQNHLQRLRVMNTSRSSKSIFFQRNPKSTTPRPESSQAKPQLNTLKPPVQFSIQNQHKRSNRYLILSPMGGFNHSLSSIKTSARRVQVAEDSQLQKLKKRFLEKPKEVKKRRSRSKKTSFESLQKKKKSITSRKRADALSHSKTQRGLSASVKRKSLTPVPSIEKSTSSYLSRFKKFRFPEKNSSKRNNSSNWTKAKKKINFLLEISKSKKKGEISQSKTIGIYLNHIKKEKKKRLLRLKKKMNKSNVKSSSIYFQRPDSVLSNSGGVGIFKSNILKLGGNKGESDQKIVCRTRTSRRPSLTLRRFTRL